MQTIVEIPKTEEQLRSVWGMGFKSIKPTKQETCDTCEHLDETDGSNCYECVKGIRNRYSPRTESEGK